MRLSNNLRRSAAIALVLAAWHWQADAYQIHECFNYQNNKYIAALSLPFPRSGQTCASVQACGGVIPACTQTVGKRVTRYNYSYGNCIVLEGSTCQACSAGQFVLCYQEDHFDTADTTCAGQLIGNHDEYVAANNRCW